jgi:NAD(P) transhydrogenase
VPYDYDLLVIGSGPAGEKGAAQAAYFGKRVAVIEKYVAPGGAAVHTGTLPSKTLRETAIYLSGYRTRELYGLSVSLDPEPRGAQADVAQGHGGDARGRPHLLEPRSPQGDLREGRARLVDAHTVEVTAPTARRARSAASSSSSRPARCPSSPRASPSPIPTSTTATPS